MKADNKNLTGGRGCIHLLALPLVTLLSTSGAMADAGVPETPTMLDEVVVTATKTPHTLKDVPVETIVVTREDIDRTNAQNVMDILKNIPGISTAAHDDTFGTYTWRATMRGLSFDGGYALILVDGERIMGSGQSGGMGEYGVGLNQVPVEMIERVEVVKGPGSALYGSDAMAGVINIITKKMPEKQIAGAGAAYGWYTVKERTRNGVSQEPSTKNRNQSQSYAYFGDRASEKVGYLMQYSQERAEDTGSSRIDSERHAFMAKGEVDLSEQMTLSLKGEVSAYDKIDNRKEDSYRLSTGFAWQPNEDHYFLLKGYTYNWDFDHGFVDDSYGHKYGDIAYHQVDGQYSWYAGDTHTLTMGAEFQRQAIDYTIDNPDGSTVRVDEDIDTFSLYLQDEILLFNDKLNIVPGVRYDDHSTFGEEVNPKLSGMYRLYETTTLRASVGRAFKSPTIRQLYYDAPYNHGSFYALSNPDLDPETSIGYSAGVEQWLLDNRMMMSVSYFRNEVDDLVLREDSGATYNGKPLMEYRNVDEATIQGVEVLSRLWPTEELSLLVSYSYTDSENKENGKNLTYVPEHQFGLTPAYEFVNYGVGISGMISYASKQYTSTDNSSQIDGFTVVDAKMYKRVSDSVKFSFEADNIFDSDKGDDGNYRVGRVFMVKMDLTL